MSQPWSAERREMLERRSNEDLTAVLATPAGRRVLWELIHQTGAFGSSYSADTHAMAYAEGRRSVGLELMVRLQGLAPNRWIEMLAESLAER